METFERERDGYTISTDPERLDMDVIHGFLVTSYWCPSVPRAVVERSVANSLPFGIYDGDSQVGFGRMVTDRAVLAYMADVFVVEEHRGRGLSKWLVETMLEHPDLRGLRRLILATMDAHELYRRFGFDALPDPGIFMTIERDPQELYERS